LYWSRKARHYLTGGPPNSGRSAARAAGKCPRCPECPIAWLDLRKLSRIAGTVAGDGCPEYPIPL
jgi:hypothetical protein